MIQIFSPASNGARDLVTRIRALGHEVRRVRRVGQLRPGGLVVNWGHRSGRRDALNDRGWFSKLGELQRLHQEGVPTVEVRVGQNPGQGWLPRRNGHHEGNDLLRPGRADYWTLFRPIRHEFRVHVARFGEEYRSIRLGMKFPRVARPHEWIRSWQAGWHLLYNEEAQQRAHGHNVRGVAKAAVEALGLDFGAVDVAIGTDGRTFVLEVNRAPGLEGQTLERYAQLFIGLDRRQG